MTSFARQALNAILPKGSAFVPKYDGGMDRLFNGIADCFEILQEAGANLAKLRLPLETDQLDDLEREFGVLPESTTSEETRRAYLDGKVHGPLSTGSDDDLESRLRLAGFDVRVHQNNPVEDPDTYLASTPAASCGDALASCGAPLVSCSRSDDGSKSLLVNERPVGDAENRLVDGDMEATGVTAWTVSNAATLTKQAGSYSGAQCLRVAYNGTNEPGAYQNCIPIGGRYRVRGFAKGDGTFYPAVLNSVQSLWEGTVAAAWQPFDIRFVSLNTFLVFTTDANAAGFVEFDDIVVTREDAVYSIPDNSATWPLVFFVGGEKTGDDFFDDWNMELGHVGAWTAGNGAVLSKDQTLYYDGIRSLKIMGSTSVDLQQIQPLNPDPDMVAFYRMDDVAGTIENLAWLNTLIDGNCEKQNGTDVIVDGDCEVTGPDVIVDGDMEVTGPDVIADGDMEAAGPDVIVDGDMEAAGVASWTADTRGTMTKDLVSPYEGTQWLKIVQPGGGANFGAKQTILTITKTYRVKGVARGDGTVNPFITEGGNVVWTGTTSTAWQPFDVVFVATSTDLRFRGYDATVGVLIGFDSIEVIDETVACADWTVGRAAILSKQNDAYEGSQCLRIGGDGATYPYAVQNILTLGKTYRVKGVAHGDGINNFRIRDNSNLLFSGTNSVVWQPFDFVFIAAGVSLRLYGETAAGYVEFDAIEVIDETVACADWRVVANALLSKQGDAYEGSQCLRVAYGGTSNPSATQTILTVGKTYRVKGWARGDGASVRPRITTSLVALWAGTTSTSWQPFDFTFVSTSTVLALKIPATAAGYAEFDDIEVIDETVACADWTIANNALLSKQESPYEGSQCLRVEYGGSGSFQAEQSILVAGKTYRARGVCRSDGSNNIGFYQNSSYLTGFGHVTAWTEFDIVFTATGASWKMGAVAGSGGYVEFDGLYVIDLTDSCDEWTASGDAVGSKVQDEDPVTGNQFLRITNGGAGGGYLKQTVMTATNDYTLHGWARGDGTAAPSVQDGAVVLWTGTTDTAWQEIDISFTAANTDLRLYCDTASQAADFDDLMLNDVSSGDPELAVDATNANGVDTTTPWIDGVDFDGASAVITATATDPKVFGHENMTIFGWFYIRDLVNMQGLVTNGSTGADTQRLSLEGGLIYFKNYIDGNLRDLSSSNYSDEDWQTSIAVTRKYDGIETTFSLYVNGVLEDTETHDGAPDVTLTTALIGYLNIARYFDGIMSDNVAFYTAEKTAEWIADEHERGLAAMFGGPYAEQELDTSIAVSRTLRARVWSVYDADAYSGLPMIYVKTALNVWVPVWFGHDADGGTARQDVSETLSDGIRAIRMYSKGGAGVGQACFDTIRIDDIEIARATVPADMRKKFERLILTTKPVHSWAGLLIDYA